MINSNVSIGGFKVVDSGGNRKSPEPHPSSLNLHQSQLRQKYWLVLLVASELLWSNRFTGEDKRHILGRESTMNTDIFQTSCQNKGNSKSAAHSLDIFHHFKMLGLVSSSRRIKDKAQVLTNQEKVRLSSLLLLYWLLFLQETKEKNKTNKLNIFTSDTRSPNAPNVQVSKSMCVSPVVSYFSLFMVETLQMSCA